MRFKFNFNNVLLGLPNKFNRTTLHKQANGNCNIFGKLYISGNVFDLFRILMTPTDGTEGDDLWRSIHGGMHCIALCG